MITEGLHHITLVSADVVDRTWYRSFHFRAPDGLLMEMSTDVPGFGLAEAA